QALGAGTPIVRALSECTTLAINAALRRKFLMWAQAMSAGATMIDGARAAGMSELVVGMLASAPHDPTAAADVFTFLARYYRSRFSRAATAIHAIAVPAVVFVFGFIVCFIALAMFLPMISLINSLSTHAGKWVL